MKLFTVFDHLNQCRLLFRGITVSMPPAPFMEAPWLVEGDPFAGLDVTLVE